VGRVGWNGGISGWDLVEDLGVSGRYAKSLRTLDKGVKSVAIKRDNKWAEMKICGHFSNRKTLSAHFYWASAHLLKFLWPREYNDLVTKRVTNVTKVA
jgi:hypothetical protein